MNNVRSIWIYYVFLNFCIEFNVNLNDFYNLNYLKKYFVTIILTVCYTNHIFVLFNYIVLY